MKQIAIIGGGAAGFFAAIHAASRTPEAKVVIFEKSPKVLQKVRISGGGRCNVTHNCTHLSTLLAHYPRGGHFLATAFQYFTVQDTIAWFEERGVRLKTEADGRMFPMSNSSEDIINSLLKAAKETGIEICLSKGIAKITKTADHFMLHTQDGTTLACSSVVITTGGYPKTESYQWLQALGHSIVAPVPSLFTFNIPDSPLNGLEGISVKNAHVTLSGINYQSSGPLLITHWGISGPAVLKCSAFAARALHACDYNFTCEVDWLPGVSLESAISAIKEITTLHPKKSFHNLQIFDLPSRLWLRICELCGITERQKAAETGKKHYQLLVKQLKQMQLHIVGKTTFKEEFVTAGGIDCNEVNAHTMESKLIPGLYFAGEVLDIDGVTGGFNFQAAWTTGYLAGMHC